MPSLKFINSEFYLKRIFHICIGTLKLYARHQIQQTDVFSFASPEEASLNNKTAQYLFRRL